MKKFITLILTFLAVLNLWGSPQSESPVIPLSFDPLVKSPLEISSLELQYKQLSGLDSSFHVELLIYNPTQELQNFEFTVPPDGDKVFRKVDPGKSLVVSLDIPFLAGNRPHRPELGGQGPLGAHLWNHAMLRPQAEELKVEFQELKKYARVGRVKISLFPLPGGWIETQFPLDSRNEFECLGIPDQDLVFNCVYPGNYSVLGVSLGTGTSFIDGDWEFSFQSSLDLSLGPVQVSGTWELVNNSPSRVSTVAKFFLPLEKRPINPLDADWDIRLGAGLIWVPGPEPRYGVRGLLGGRWHWIPVEFSYDWDWAQDGTELKQHLGAHFVLGF